MTAAENAVRLIARTLPVGVRNRYREEWLADIEGSRELGLKPGSVVGAAVITALTMDRTHPSITGIPRAQLARRRASWAAAFLGSAAVLAVGLFLWGGYQNLSIVLPGPGLVINAVGMLVGSATAAFLLLGIITAVAALTAAADAHGWKLLRYLGLGVVASVVALPVLCLVPRLDRVLSTRRILVIGLLVVGGTVFFQWVAGFGMGMSMADTFMTSGGDAAPTGAVLTIFGQVALVAALLVGLRPHRLVAQADS